MAFKINTTEVVPNAATVSWNQVYGYSANLITTITINGTGTTGTFCPPITGGTIVFYRS